MKQKILLPALMLAVGMAAGAIGGRMTAEPSGKQDPLRALDEKSYALYKEISAMQKDICIKQAKRDLLCYDCGQLFDFPVGVEITPEMYIAKRAMKIEVDCPATLGLFKSKEPKQIDYGKKTREGYERTQLLHRACLLTAKWDLQESGSTEDPEAYLMEHEREMNISCQGVVRSKHRSPN